MVSRIEDKRIWRWVILGLLLIAFAGPWAFDRINVPSEYSCSAPFIRLQGDYCGAPLPGALILPMIVGAFVDMVVRLVTSNLVATDFGQALPVFLVGFLLFLPFVSTLLLFWPGNRRRKHGVHMVVWGLAIASNVWWLLISPTGHIPSLLWGPWLYLGLGLCMLVFELVLTVRSRTSQAG